jgi:hypothetical protein
MLDKSLDTNDKHSSLLRYKISYGCKKILVLALLTNIRLGLKVTDIDKHSS